MTARQHQTWGEEWRALWAVAGPLIVNFLAVAGMSFADAVMAGRISPRDLAAVSVGASTWMLGFIICLGFLMALSPIIARHFGAGRYELIGRYTRQGLWISQALALSVLVFVQLYIQGIFETIGIDADFRELATGYVQAIFLGLPAMAVFLVLRFTTEGIGITRPIMYTSLFSLVSNVFLNYVLMFGKFGAPAMGAVGCGLASAITMWLMAIVLGAYVYYSKRYSKLQIFSRVAPLRLSIFKEVLSLGWPIMITILAESGMFSAISLLFGTLGTSTAAAHQIGINFASTAFMVPLALSSAITVRVGHELGAGNPMRARFAGIAGITFSAGFMLFSATLMLIFRDQVVHLYTDDVQVQAIAISLLLMAAIFQVADGVQISAAGALRGYKDTRVPMVINVIAYWALGFPCAYYAAKVLELEPRMIWAAFIIALGISAVLLSIRYVIVAGRIVRDPTVLNEPA